MKVKCKDCKCTWDNLGDYMKRQRCDKSNCKVNKGSPMEQAANASPAVRQIKLRVIQQEVDVRSDYQNAVNECVYIEVPRIISVKIYPRGGGR